MDEQLAQAAVIGAFLMDGAGEYWTGEGSPDPYPDGCIEFVCDMTRLCLPALLEADNRPVEFPGVFAYEVVSEMGKWFAWRTDTGKAIPDQDECLEVIKQLVDSFFEQGLLR